MLEIGVGAELGSLKYYMFDQPEFNTFNREIIPHIEQRGFPKLLKVKDVPVQPLSKILSDTLRPDQEIDFMDVDCEGLDLVVLKSNDWKRFRPRMLVAEVDPDNPETHQFMRRIHYALFAKTFSSTFYIDTKR